VALIVSVIDQLVRVSLRIVTMSIQSQGIHHPGTTSASVSSPQSPTFSSSTR
jgi:hypothetical protein